MYPSFESWAFDPVNMIGYIPQTLHAWIFVHTLGGFQGSMGRHIYGSPMECLSTVLFTVSIDVKNGVHPLSGVQPNMGCGSCPRTAAPQKTWCHSWGREKATEREQMATATTRKTQAQTSLPQQSTKLQKPEGKLGTCSALLHNT